jgi:hypothetical protein
MSSARTFFHAILMSALAGVLAWTDHVAAVLAVSSNYAWQHSAVATAEYPRTRVVIAGESMRLRSASGEEFTESPHVTLNNTGEIVRIEKIHTVLTGQHHDLPLPNGNLRQDWMSSQSNTPALSMPPTRNLTQNLAPIPSRSPNPSLSDLPIGYESKAEVIAEEDFIQRNAENSGEYVGPRIRQTIPPGKSLSCYKSLFEGHTLTDTHGNVWSFARNHYFTPEFRWCDAVINGHLARNGDFTSVIRLVRGKIYGESAKGNGWWLWDGFSFSVNVGRPP